MHRKLAEVQTMLGQYLDDMGVTASDKANDLAELIEHLDDKIIELGGGTAENDEPGSEVGDEESVYEGVYEDEVSAEMSAHLANELTVARIKAAVKLLKSYRITSGKEHPILKSAEEFLVAQFKDSTTE